MWYPYLDEIPKERTVVEVFGGYNHNLRIGEGEFYDMRNMSADDYPVISTRQKRGNYAATESAQGLISKDTLCYVDGDKLYVDNYAVEGLTLENSPKQLISMGAYIIILPDKKYVNTKDLTDFGNIEAETTTTGTVSFEMCTAEGESLENLTTSAAEPDQPQNADYWMDNSGGTLVLKQYSSSAAVWVSVTTTYVKITSPGIGKAFSQYDGVNIAGIKHPEELNASSVIWAKDDDWIVVVGILDASATQEEPVTVSRRMPNMDFVIEANNRLWGCRYGTALNGDVVNEIYASKLGDFKNWSCYMGVSTDSYAVSLGSDGQFTGAITHRGYPIFFKENCLHKVYGNYPANYQLQTTECRGVQRGCDKSLAIVNEVLYYKSTKAVVAYDGSLPVEISNALGNIQYFDAVAGGIGNRYYINMADADGKYHLFVFDTVLGTWHKEDNVRVKAFCACRNELYFIDEETGGIRSIRGNDEKPVDWMLETGDLGLSAPEKKYVSRIVLRLALERDAEVHLSIQYENDGRWQPLRSVVGTSFKSFPVQVRPQRCDHFRLRLEGVGGAKIYSIAKTTEQGSDVE